MIAASIRNDRDALEPNILNILNSDGDDLYFSRALIPWDSDAGDLDLVSAYCIIYR